MTKTTTTTNTTSNAKALVQWLMQMPGATMQTQRSVRGTTSVLIEAKRNNGRIRSRVRVHESDAQWCPEENVTMPGEQELTVYTSAFRNQGKCAVLALEHTMVAVYEPHHTDFQEYGYKTFKH